jgi:hypothetical protein
VDRKTSYHLSVQRLQLMIVVVLGVLFVPPLRAQVRGLPPTATSLGPGGQVVSPLPPTATSVGPGAFGNSGVAPGFGMGTRLVAPGFTGVRGFGRHHHHLNGTFIGGAYPVYVPVPIATLPYWDSSADETADEAEADRPAATVFERGYRRNAEQYPHPGDDADDYVPQPARHEDGQPRETTQESESKPVPAQPASVLVFKDGHRLELQNYAIVGDTLYDFTPGHQRRIALSQLDLKATADANESAGIEFQVPGRRQ